MAPRIQTPKIHQHYCSECDFYWAHAVPEGGYPSDAAVKATHTCSMCSKVCYLHFWPGLYNDHVFPPRCYNHNVI